MDKVNRGKIEAILGLRMLHFKELEETQPLGTRSLRILDIEKATFDRWIRREAETIKAKSSERTGDETLRIVGIQSTIQPRSDLLAVISETPLEAVCGQLLLSAFIAGIAEEISETIGGIVRVRSGQRAMASFGWRNSVLDKLAEEVEGVGLVIIEEALLSIVPPLEKAGSCPPISAQHRFLKIQLRKYRHTLKADVLIWPSHFFYGSWIRQNPQRVHTRQRGSGRILAAYLHGSSRRAIVLMAAENMRARLKKRWDCFARGTSRFLQHRQVTRGVSRIRWAFCVQLWTMEMSEQRDWQNGRRT